MDDFKKYREMKTQNASPRQTYCQAKLDGLDEITIIRMLRDVFGLSLAQAKEAAGASEALALLGEQITPDVLRALATPDGGDKWI